MMKTVKRRYELFQFYNSDGIEAHLTKMAERGWQLEKINPFYWQYQRIEPQKLYYKVRYSLPKLANQGLFYTEGQNTDWFFVAKWAQMQIFCSEKQGPSLEGEQESKLQALQSAMKKNTLPIAIVFVFLGILQTFLQLQTFHRDPVYFLSNNAAISTALAWGMLTIAFFVQLAGYFCWSTAAQKAIAQGDLPKSNQGSSRLFFWTLALVLGILLMFTVSALAQRSSWALAIKLLPISAIILLILWLRNTLQRAGIPFLMNLLATFVLCLILSIVLASTMSWASAKGLESVLIGEEFRGEDSSPWINTWNLVEDFYSFSIEDWEKIDDEYYSWHFTMRSSLFVTYFMTYQYNPIDAEELPSQVYEIIDIKWPIFYEVCLESMLNNENAKQTLQDVSSGHYRQIDDPLWQADALYQMHIQNVPQSKYLICWGNRIVEVQFDEIPTPEQIAITVQKLKEAKLV